MPSIVLWLLLLLYDDDSRSNDGNDVNTTQTASSPYKNNSGYYFLLINFIHPFLFVTCLLFVVGAQRMRNFVLKQTTVQQPIVHSVRWYNIAIPVALSFESNF